MILNKLSILFIIEKLNKLKYIIHVFYDGYIRHLSTKQNI